MTSVQERKGLENLNLWNISIQLAVDIIRDMLPLFPSEEKFSLSMQLRRAVQSIPANIAEGYGRFYYQEDIRFCYIARGSIEEVNSHLCLARKLGYISSEIYNRYVSRVIELRKMVNGYIAYLKRSKRGEKEPGNIYPDGEDYSNKISENQLSDYPFEEVA